MAKAIVFDMDGTIIDSTDAILKSAHFTSRQLGLGRLKDEDIRSRIGLHLKPMMASLFQVDGVLLEEAVKTYSNEYVRIAPEEEHLFDGALELIQELREKGFKLAIATGRTQAGADNGSKRRGITHLFDSIHGILPNTPGKPDPAVLIRAMDALGVSPEETLMIGDTVFDISLAQKVGVRTAAVSWGVHSVEKLQAQKPDVLVHDFAELREWLLAQKS